MIGMRGRQPHLGCLNRAIRSPCEIVTSKVPNQDLKASIDPVAVVKDLKQQQYLGFVPVQQDCYAAIADKFPNASD
jgi:hypothetical protein